MSNKIKKIYLTIVVCVAILLILFANIFLKINKKIDSNAKEYPFKNEYINKSEYKGKFRRTEYIGGKVLYVNRNIVTVSAEMQYNGERWYSFYKDLDTNEILRGLENYSYITAGIPYIGLDHLDVPKERKTKKGFQDYVLTWTGSILYRNIGYISDRIMRENIYGKNSGKGLYECKLNSFDMPIDLLAYYRWESPDAKNIENEYKIKSIDELKKFNYGMHEIKFTENEWILSILKNCFGFISDDFYDLFDNNKLNFNECEIKDVEIGDIGVFGNDKDGYRIGICIGYDKKMNPVFSVCSSNSINPNFVEINGGFITSNYKGIEYGGYNALHIENLNGTNNAFAKYFKTFLPFTDDNIKVKDLIITDIKQYNEQALFLNDDIKSVYTDIFSDKVHNERYRRISEREDKSKINNSIINNIPKEDDDISLIYFINEKDSYEYRSFLNKNATTKYEREKYSERVKKADLENKKNREDYIMNITDEEYMKIYEGTRDDIREWIINYRYEIKKCKDDSELREFVYSMHGTELELKFIQTYIAEYPNILDND